MVTPRDAWRRQKNSAIKRGLGWNFTFEEWCNWWAIHLGPDWFNKRGRKPGQFVMARKGDTGPYDPRNVRCATAADNHVEYNANRQPAKRERVPRLTAGQVLAIFNAHGRYVDIAAAHGTDSFKVHCIKTGKYYRRITKIN